MNINNVVGLHYNHSCLILWICVLVYGFMDTIFPPLLISIISDFSIVGKSILNSKELFLLPWFLEPLCSLIPGPSLSLLMCLPPLSIFLQLLCSLFVLVFFLLSWYHALATLMSDLLENLTLHFFIVSLNAMIAALSDSSDLLSIFMHVTKKRHDMMNQNWPSFSGLKMITSILSFHYFNGWYFNKCLEYC